MRHDRTSECYTGGMDNRAFAMDCLAAIRFLKKVVDKSVDNCLMIVDYPFLAPFELSFLMIERNSSVSFPFCDPL